MSADLLRRGLIVGFGLLIAAGGGLLMASARGGWAGFVPPTADLAVARILDKLRTHDAASREGDDRARIAALRAARQDLTDLLARRPSDGDQWAMLARIDAAFAGFHPGVKSALDMSRLTARREQAAIEKRIQLGVTFWSALDDDERDRVNGDMRMLLSVPEPRHRVIATLADIARGQDAPGLAAVRTAVAGAAPAWRSTFEQFLVQPPKF